MIDPSTRNRIKVKLVEKQNDGGPYFVAEFNLKLHGRSDVNFSIPAELLPSMIDQSKEALEKAQDFQWRWGRAATKEERIIMGIERTGFCQVRDLLQDNVEEAMRHRDDAGVTKLTFGVKITPTGAFSHKVETTVGYRKAFKYSMEDEILDPDAPKQSEMEFSDEEEDAVNGDWPPPIRRTQGTVIDVDLALPAPAMELPAPQEAAEESEPVIDSDEE